VSNYQKNIFALISNSRYFRDYLIEHANIAIEYERMKLKLWKKYEFNRDDYTNSKTDFIQKYTEKAKLEYGDRY
uniref:GrpB family protein n=2 Tax=Paraprevotella clara TaxID=454154 RepID=UPI0040296858